MSTLVYSKYDDRILTVLDPNDAGGAAPSGSQPFLGNFAFGALPAPAVGNTGATAFVSNVGPNGSMWMSTGTKWVPVNGSVLLAQTNIPVILIPNFTITAGGVITLAAPLGLVVDDAWVYLNAGVVVSGLGGLYYCKFTSTTVGQVYTNFAGAGAVFTPNIPVAPVPAVCTANSYVSPTSEVPLYSINVPGGVMGPQGILQSTLLYRYSNSGSNTLKLNFGGVTVFSDAETTNQNGGQAINIIRNAGKANVQYQLNPTAIPGIVAPTLLVTNTVKLAINTAVDQQIQVLGKITTATTDHTIIQGLSIQLLVV